VFLRPVRSPESQPCMWVHSPNRVRAP
jgi:hypothetical protein